MRESFAVEKFPACVINRILVLHHFVPLNKHTNGKQFATDTDVKQTVTSSLQMLGHKFLLCQGASLGTNATLSMVPTDPSHDTYLLLGQEELLLSSMPTLF